MSLCPLFAFQKGLMFPGQVQESVYLQPGMEPFSRCEWFGLRPPTQQPCSVSGDAKFMMRRLEDKPYEWLSQVIDTQNWNLEYREWAPFGSQSHFHMSVFICMKLGVFDE